ncbi:MAG: hypothetical protein JWR19_3911 [Pedosphaera sp.]|nr:hypothetical protein [Pedosphaera sp.]
MNTLWIDFVTLGQSLARRFIVSTVVAACLLCHVTNAAQNVDEAKVGAYTLPDPLVLQNGKPVLNSRTWHEITPSDWNCYFDFVDLHLKGRP